MSNYPAFDVEENVIYLTPEAIKEHFEYQIETKSEIGEFIANASTEALREIGSIAYWDDRLWDAFHTALWDAVRYYAQTNKEQK